MNWKRTAAYYAGAELHQRTGEMDSCIAHRTAVVKNNKMHVQAGAGIVYDSVVNQNLKNAKKTGFVTGHMMRSNLIRICDMLLHNIDFAL